MAFGVVLFTLLVKGTTMQLLLRRLGLLRSDEIALEYERRHGRLMVARAARERLRQLSQDGMVTAATFEPLVHELEAEVQVQLAAQLELLREHPSLQEEEREDARREGLRAGRAMLATLMNDGAISEFVYEELVAEVDAALEGNSEVEEGELDPSPTE